jgi:hypothetical protein
MRSRLMLAKACNILILRAVLTALKLQISKSLPILSISREAPDGIDLHKKCLSMINSRVVKSFVVQSLVREEKMHVTSEIMEKLGNRVQTLQQQFSATWTPAHKKHQLQHSILFVT